MSRFLLPLCGWLLALLPLTAAAQIDTTGGRYYQPVFPQVTVTRGVTYGSAVNVLGQTQQLLFDFYEPTGDTLARRPLIVFAHEGGFVGGVRNDQFSTALANRLAKLGYCVASIDYRLLFVPFDTLGLATAGYRAMQDMRGAIRFFRADAQATNQYRIAPSFIVAAGSSAGAVTALNVGYFDKPTEVPGYLASFQLGSLEGTSGPAGPSSRPQAVVALCGALNRLKWLEAGDVPVCLVHGTADATVPYGRGTAGSGLPPLRTYGSGLIGPRAAALGIRDTLVTLQGAPHVPYNGTSPQGVAYFDTTFRAVRDFLRPLVAQATIAPLGLAQAKNQATAAQAYPVPSAGSVWLHVPSGAAFSPTDAALVDHTGRIVRRFRWTAPNQELSRNGLPAGAYVVRVAGRAVARVVLE